MRQINRSDKDYNKMQQETLQSRKFISVHFIELQYRLGISKPTYLLLFQYELWSCQRICLCNGPSTLWTYLKVTYPWSREDTAGGSNKPPLVAIYWTSRDKARKRPSVTGTLVHTRGKFMSVSFQISVAAHMPLFSQESMVFLFPGGMYFQTGSYCSHCPPCDSIWWHSLELFPPAQQLRHLQKSLFLMHLRLTYSLSFLLQHNHGTPSNSSMFHDDFRGQLE